jgi:glycosyltransferase involved in cell wall biosynthesis
MKIAILTSGILPVPAVQGGAVENLIDFYLAYNEQQKLHDITVYSIKHPKTKQHPALSSDVNHYYYIDTSCTIAKIRRSFYRLFQKDEYYNYFIEYYFEQAFKHLRKQSYDCIILENRPGYAYKLSQRLSTRLVLHLHNDLLNQDSKFHTEVLNSLHKILTVSDYIKSRVCSIEGTDKVHTIYNGIDIQRFSPQTAIDINRKNLGLAENDFILLYSGRINKDKGVSELIDAMLNLKDTPQIKLLILGSSFFGDASNDDPFVSRLKQKAETINDRIYFTGFIPYSILPQYLWISNAAVVPSVWEEPFGNTVVEAMAAGLPLITTRSGGIPEICEGVATIVERENIVDNLATAILYLFHHPEKRQKMAAASLERSKLFNKDTFAKNFFAALENL